MRLCASELIINAVMRIEMCVREGCPRSVYFDEQNGNKSSRRLD